MSQPGKSVLSVGCAREDITPRRSVPLAGFAGRTAPSEGIDHQLFIRCAVFEDRHGRRALLVSADVIWFDPELVSSWKLEIAEIFGIPAHRQILAATHTHCAPAAGPHFSPTLGEWRPWYSAMLRRRLHRAIAAAVGDLEPVRSFRRGTAECRLGVNRRRRVGDEITMAPNPSGAIDRTVTVLEILTESGISKVRMCHFACHPTTQGGSRISSEYCGAAMDRIERIKGGLTMFLQGCAGNIRPNLQRGGRFYMGNDRDVVRLSESLFASVVAAMRRMREFPFSGRIEGGRKLVKLPFQKPIPKQELEALAGEVGLSGKWARQMLVRKLPLFAELELLRVDIGGLSFLAANGEMVSEYGLLLQRLDGRPILPVAYANGMTGYIPTDVQIAEGGYEGGGAHRAFLLPAPFQIGVEGKILEAMRSLAVR